MPDVFVSYSRDDRKTAQRFAQGFEREGFRVWWDQAIVPGEAFDRVTEKALQDARVVVVLWSKRSVESDWVRAEATEARATGRLVPVMIEPCKRPVIFELTQTADLIGWDGDPGDPRWRALVDGLRRTLGPPRPDAQGASPPPAAATSPGSGLRAPWIAALALAVLAAAGATWFMPRGGAPAPAATSAPPPPVPADEPASLTLAVLPFANRSPDAAQEYFSDGLTEEIINQLTRVPALRVTGRTSSFSFKGKDEDLRKIGATLGVEYLLEGSVRKDGEQLRVTARLVRATDGSHRWSQTYDRSLSGVFAVQDEIAKDVARALSVTLDIGTLNRAQGGTTNVAAFDAYLRWREFRLSERRDTEEERRMAQGLREAVALDPGFLLAWDGLARSLATLASRAPAEEAVQLRAEAAAARARIEALAPESWIARRERAYALFGEGRFADAIDIARQIMDESPRSWEQTYPYTFLIFAVGRLNESFRIVAELQAAEPLATFMSRDQQWILTALRRFADAEAEYARSLTLKGGRAEPQSLRFTRLLARGDADPAELRAQFGALRDAWPVELPAYLLAFEPLLGDREAMLASLRRAAAARPTPSMAYYADALGDAELAASILRATWSNPRANVYSRYEALWTLPHSAVRTTPAFKALLRESGLVDYWRRTGAWADACLPVGDDDFRCE